MAPLRNPRHEKFIHNYLQSGDATAAFEATGYTRDSANAHRLLKRPQVQARLRELQDEIAAKVPITIESLIGELEDVRHAAASKNQFAAAVRSILGKAQLAGLLIERSKVEVSEGNPFAGMEDMDAIGLKMVDDICEFKFSAYHDYTAKDRQHMADMFQRYMEAFSAEMDAFVNKIKARPHKTVNLKALPSTLNGKGDSQSATD